MTRLLVLLRQRMRRDLAQLVLWIGGTVALGALAYVGVMQTFGTEQDRAALLAAAIANPVILLFRGLPSGIEQGAFIAFLILPFQAMLAAFFSSFLAVRHTRGDEESDRTELVAATPAGRVLPLAATLMHGMLANLVLGALVGASYLALGLGARGSASMGLATAATGLAFLGIGTLAAQLVLTSRAANALSVWVLLLSFLACGIGNAVGTPSADLQRMQSAALAWTSPFGWAENTRPFDADDLRPLLLSAALALVCVAIAVTLQAVRDIGGSVLPERSGRARAGAALAGPIGLVWRLSRGAVIGWAVGGLVSGLLATRLADAISQVGDSIPSVQAVVQSLSAGGSLAQGAVTIFFTMVGVLASCCAVQTIGRARQEEASGTVEPVLAAAVGRMRWLAGYVAIGLVGIALTCAAAVGGAALGLATLPEAEWSLLGDAAVTGAGQLAAAAVFLVLAALVLVLAPRLTLLAGWTLVVVGMILGLFGPLFGLPDAAVNVSPIAVTPTVNADGVDLRGLWWLVLTAVAGGSAAFVLVRRRELTP